MALLLQPYPIQKTDQFTYAFNTSKGIEYNCSFVTYAEYFPNHPKVAPYFFAFNLEQRDKKIKLPSGTDKQIADTIITIVGDFLNSEINAVVYICDNSDGREAIRARKFLSWYNYEEHPSHKIIKVSGDLDAGGITLYTALLVHKNNKLKKELVQAYLELIDYEDEK
jgi:hypothetical protein